MEGPSRKTIAAIATAAGSGGVGIIRVSGPEAERICRELTGIVPEPHRFRFARFRDVDGEVIDLGLVLFFRGPGSFTGEDVVEFHGHGGVVVLDSLLARVLELGAEIAKPGEFSERAFLNGKIDLTQAEAVSDLVNAGSRTAARLAVRSIEGEFSRRVYMLADELGGIRVHVEAGLDFSDEEIDLAGNQTVLERLKRFRDDLRVVTERAAIGRLMRDGISVVIAGPPNAGKSSLMNAMVGYDAAIVTEVPGTTRDLLRERIQVHGIPVHLYDTAGLRDSDCRIEAEGVRRARKQIERADVVVWVLDDSDPAWREYKGEIPVAEDASCVVVSNKVDLTGGCADKTRKVGPLGIEVSAKTGQGLDLLLAKIAELAGFAGESQGEFLARRRHLDALGRCGTMVERAVEGLGKSVGIELVAEDLRLAQKALGEITGEVTTEDLLGKIFADFCIGK